MTGQRDPPLSGRNTKVLSLIPSRIATMTSKARTLPDRSTGSIGGAPSKNEAAKKEPVIAPALGL
jgi:hypothetical protein